MKDPAQFQEFLYKTTKLSPRVVAELFNSTVNVQKVGTDTCTYVCYCKGSLHMLAMKALSTQSWGSAVGVCTANKIFRIFANRQWIIC